jgi:hypothetical protein
MAGIRITDLDSATGIPADSDRLVIVDISDNITKQISLSRLLSNPNQTSQNSQNAQQVTINNTTVDQNYYLSYVTNTSGSNQVFANELLSYNPVTNILTAGGFSGDGSSLTGVIAETATSATNVNVNNAEGGAFNVALVIGDGEQAIYRSTNLTYDEDTETLTAVNFSGTFIGDGSQLTNLPFGGGGGGSAATTLNVVATDLNATHYILFSGSSSGLDSVNADLNLTYNANTNVLTAGTFSGAHTGDGSALTGVVTSFATNAGSSYQIQVKGEEVSSSVFDVFFSGSVKARTTGSVTTDSVSASDGFTYRPSDGTLTVARVAGTADNSLNAVQVTTVGKSSSASALEVLYTGTTVVRANGTTYTDSVGVSDSFTYTPSTNTLTVGRLDGVADSAIVANTIRARAQDSSSDSLEVLFTRTSVTRTQNQIFTDSVGISSSLTYTPNSGTLTAQYFSGNGSGLTNVAALTATVATNAANVAIAAVSTSAEHYLHFGTAISGYDDVNIDADLTYNPSTNTLRLDADGASLVIGENTNIQFSHSGTNAFIDVNTGNLYVRDNLDSVHSLFDILTGDFHVDGDVVAFSTLIASDPKLKTNIQSLQNSLEKVNQLNGVSWNWKSDNTPSAGVISTDVKKVLPQAVSVRSSLNSSETFEIVNYDAIVGLLVEAVKDLSLQIEELKSKTCGCGCK